MEESLKTLAEKLGGHVAKAEQYSPLSLAYIGDAVFEVIVRYVVMSGGNRSVNRMHKAASAMVNAGAQSDMVSVLQEEWTEEEAAVFKRGRNAESNTSARNAGITEYRRATGLEAVFGYLFLKGEYSRLLELAEKALRSGPDVRNENHGERTSNHEEE